MVFMYIVAGTVVVLLLSVALAVVKQREIKVDVISREPVEDKEFFALRIESDDFLFIRDEEAVTFIQSLDDVSDYKIVNLSEEDEMFAKDKLVMPMDEKKAS
ncbi:MAG: hypothetical protein ACRBBP_01950 [Bdellovibrionales bacterium]